MSLWFAKNEIKPNSWYYFWWLENISLRALPYAEAMMNLNNKNDKYGQNDAKIIISYFLSNAKQWQGKVAREIKNIWKNVIPKMSILRKK